MQSKLACLRSGKLAKRVGNTQHKVQHAEKPTNPILYMKKYQQEETRALPTTIYNHRKDSATTAAPPPPPSPWAAVSFQTGQQKSEKQTPAACKHLTVWRLRGDKNAQDFTLFLLQSDVFLSKNKECEFQTRLKAAFVLTFYKKYVKCYLTWKELLRFCLLWDALSSRWP